MKLLRTIRLDASDSFVFDPPANSGEWAVPGGFMFFDRDPATLSGRERQAFRSGFLGLTSFGWSTLVVVVEATPEERAAAVDALARHLIDRHGAPDLATARAAAEDEIAFAESLADHPEQTLVAIHRQTGDDGAVREQFRTLHKAAATEAARMPCSAGAFAIVEDAAAAAHDAAAADDIDLAALVGGNDREGRTS